LERILGLTAFAAGTVDIISFAGLGGVFASAMTGNLAFLGLYLARFSLFSALGSAVALVGFVVGGVSGTLLGRGRDQHAALTVLLGCETLLLISAVPIWLSTSHHEVYLSADALILLLSVSMGLQSIVGKRVNLSNISTVVFTSTLTNIVIAITDMLATRNYVLPKDTKRQCVSFLLYFLGALYAGYCVFFKLKVLIFLPVAAVGYAFVLGRSDELLKQDCDGGEDNEASIICE
jgi:uncharacterized membrane protein YoaK (UPF0700 family)